jgi:MarR family transcriptional regulator, organic hydroperoxide resistance regulator
LQLLWAVAHGLESKSKQMRAELGVTGPQRFTLRLVGHFGRLSPGDLAELLHIDPSSLTGILQRLERAKMLRRLRDPNDKRRAILELTQRGRGVLASPALTVEDFVRSAIASLPDRKLRAAQDVLAVLATELGAEAPTGSLGHAVPNGTRSPSRRRSRPVLRG